MSDTQKGVVKWFNDAKGFGFIEHSSGRDVFVHYSVIEADGFKTLKDGEEVEYEIKEGPKGLHAVKVQRINPKSPDGQDSEEAAEGSSQEEDSTTSSGDSEDSDEGFEDAENAAESSAN